MNGRCGICGNVLGTGDTNGICVQCLNERSIRKDTAQYRTYENGFKDGYATGIINLELIRKAYEKAISSVQVKYIVVTQEQLDEILKKADHA